MERQVQRVKGKLTVTQPKTRSFIGDVGVHIQRGGAGDVADNSGQRFDVHAMLQGVMRVEIAELRTQKKVS